MSFVEGSESLSKSLMCSLVSRVEDARMRTVKVRDGRYEDELPKNDDLEFLSECERSHFIL